MVFAGFISGTKGTAVFTGLIQEVSSVVDLLQSKGNARLAVTAPGIVKNVKIGNSVAVNGCCLTIAARRGDQLRFDLLQETLDRTNLKDLRTGSLVNLELALAANGRLGGHFVQGHIDCTARVLALDKTGTDHRLEIELPRDFAHYVAPKGSIAIDGISFTVAEVSNKSFAVWVIPYTKQHTNLRRARVGDLLNLEFDILAKYVEKIVGRRST